MGTVEISAATIENLKEQLKDHAEKLQTQTAISDGLQAKVDQLDSTVNDLSTSVVHVAPIEDV